MILNVTNIEGHIEYLSRLFISFSKVQLYFYLSRVKSDPVWTLNRVANLLQERGNIAIVEPQRSGT